MLSRVIIGAIVFSAYQASYLRAILPYTPNLSWLGWFGGIWPGSSTAETAWRKSDGKEWNNGSPAEAREATGEELSIPSVKWAFLAFASRSSRSCLGEFLAFGASWRSKSSPNTAKIYRTHLYIRSTDTTASKCTTMNVSNITCQIMHNLWTYMNKLWFVFGILRFCWKVLQVHKYNVEDEVNL